MKKSLGKREKMSEEGLKNILQSYLNFKENEISKIFENSYFGYTEVQVEQPLVEDGKIIKNLNQATETKYKTSRLRKEYLIVNLLITIMKQK